MAQTTHVNLQIAVVNVNVGPCGCDQFVLSHQLTATLHQQMQEFKGSAAEFDGLVVEQQLLAFRIETKWTKRKYEFIRHSAIPVVHRWPQSRPAASVPIRRTHLAGRSHDLQLAWAQLQSQNREMSCEIGKQQCLRKPRGNSTIDVLPSCSEHEGDVLQKPWLGDLYHAVEAVDGLRRRQRRSVGESSAPSTGNCHHAAARLQKREITSLSALSNARRAFAEIQMSCFDLNMVGPASQDFYIF